MGHECYNLRHEAGGPSSPYITMTSLAPELFTAALKTPGKYC